jgi:myo-inositol-1(or 4)-monophosphatase
MQLPRFAPVDTPDSLLVDAVSLANEMADAAAEISLSYFRKPMDVQNKAGDNLFDPVTLADKKVEQLIRSSVAARFPAHGFYGEEGDNTNHGQNHIWVVDPIDGTRAFITGMPAWGTLIALFDGEQVVLGLLDQPFLQERFIAYGGVSSLHNKQGVQKLSTRTTKDMSTAIMHCTTPDMFTDPKQLISFNRVAQEFAMTRYGGDCYGYALLAMGFIDAVVEADLQPYDIQALIPIVTSAGGVVTNWQGDSAVAGGAIVASANPALHEQLLRRLNQ